jgi:hypothetical protein
MGANDLNNEEIDYKWLQISTKTKSLKIDVGSINYAEMKEMIWH